MKILLDLSKRFAASLLNSGLNEITDLNLFKRKLSASFKWKKKRVEKLITVILINKIYFGIVQTSALFLYIAIFRWIKSKRLE